MGTVSNFALRYLLINAQRTITPRQCILPAVRAFKNFTRVNLETAKISNVKQLFIQKPNTLATCMKFSDIQQEPNKTKTIPIQNDVKLTKWQRLKKMYKEYWYIVVPVHLITSAAWYGGFYYLATSGIDIVGYLEYFGASEFFIKPLRDSSMGYFAVAYALYKIFTPLRYTVTLGNFFEMIYSERCDLSLIYYSILYFIDSNIHKERFSNLMKNIYVYVFLKTISWDQLMLVVSCKKGHNESKADVHRAQKEAPSQRKFSYFKRYKIGGTTISIKFLKNRGYIKPVPSKTEIKEIYQQKKGEIQESLRETKKGLQQRKQNISYDFEHYRKELKSLNQATKIDPKPK